MAFEAKDNTGSLFVNDRKESDRHPDSTGKAMIGGVEYYVSAWRKEGKRGKFLSLAFKPIEERGRNAPAQQRQSRIASEDDTIF